MNGSNFSVLDQRLQVEYRNRAWKAIAATPPAARNKVTALTIRQWSGGKDSHLRRENPPDLQSGAIDYSATSGYLCIIPKKSHVFYQVFHIQSYSLTNMAVFNILLQHVSDKRSFNSNDTTYYS